MQNLIKDMVVVGAKGENFELVDVEISAKTVKIFIDKPGGVKLGDCTAFSRKLLNLFEEDPDRRLDEYRLEVSSPGIDRPLGNRRDFERNLEKKTTMMFTSDDSVKSIQGIIHSVTDEMVTIRTNKKSFDIPYQSIKKAVLVLEW